MKEFMSALGELQPATLVLLIFAAVLLLLLLILIIVTIRVLKSGPEMDDDREESAEKDKSEDEKSDEEDEDEEEEDETTKKINEAVKSVEETKAKMEAEKIAREAEAARKAKEEEERAGAKAKVEEIAQSVKKGSSDEEEEEEEPAEDEDYEDEYEDSDDEFGDTLDDDTEVTGKLDTVKIEEELRKAGYMDEKDGTEDVENQKAKSEEYDAELDSAFVDKPEVPEGKTLDATEEAVVAGAVKATLQKEPKEKKKKKKPAEAVIEKPPFAGVKSYWYNKQDVEGLARKEDIYFKSHYFEDPDEPVLDLITEMYDCGFVRTEQLQRIAYGITFKSLGMKEILQSEEKIGFSKAGATKEPTESDKEEIYKKWCEYVDSFKDIIVLETTNEIEDYIFKKMYAYGHKDVEELMNSPY